jgi:uncharacterized protein
MSRPQCCRRVGHEPPCAVFKPAGVAARLLEEIVLTLDEFEALRLADLNGLYQEQAAASMNVSRQTFGRIIDGARRKTAEALIQGKALRIEGGKVELEGVRQFRCQDCRHAWELSFDGSCPAGCPSCGSVNFRRENCGGRDGEGRQVRKRCCHRGSEFR